MTKTRIQLRGVCPVCFGEFATKHGRMVAHGYTLELGIQYGNCVGVDKFHFGTIEGKEVLAERIEATRSRVTQYQNAISNLSGSNQDYRRSKRFEFELRELNYLEQFQTERLAGWKEAPLREVNLDVEEAEQRKEREQAAEQRRIEREAKEAEQQANRMAKAEKAAQNAAKKLAELQTTGYVRIWFDGDVINEWEQENGFETERDFYQTCNELRNEHFKSLNTGEHLDTFNAPRYLYEMRNKPDGKGRRVIHLTLCSSPAAYFNRYHQ